MNINQLIKSKRIATGQSQTTFAIENNFSQSDISKWETNVQPMAKSLKRLCKSLKISPLELGIALLQEDE